MGFVGGSVRRRVAWLVVALLVPLLAVATEVARPTVAEARTVAPFRGLGAWVDRFDWSVTHGGPDPAIGLAAIDRLAAEGVTTLYLQTATPGSADVLERPRLQALVDRAHARGMAVVGWHLPKLVDPAADLASLLAMRSLGVDAIGVDIEDLTVGDVAERNRRLVALSRQLRAAAPDVTLSAIVLPPVVTDVLNTSYWPAFPWAELAPLYDVWQPMGYWTNRTPGTIYRDGYRYTAENIDRLRAHLGDPGAAVHPVGGLADVASVQEVQGMVLAAAERGALGISLYDALITRPDLWPVLRLAGGAPVGSLDRWDPGPRSIHVAGWALDADTTQPVDVHVYVDGVGRANVVADEPRADIARSFPDHGGGHGFHVAVGDVAPGRHEVCTYAIGRGGGGNALLGCRTVVVPTGSPWGSFDAATTGLRSIEVRGWAIDPDVAGPVDVHVYVDGVGRANVAAAGRRLDLRRAHPGWEGQGAFTADLGDVAPGAHVVCAFAIDQGPGDDVALGCRRVVVSSSPAGAIDALDVVAPRTVRLRGWAVDPDTPAPVDVHVYVDGVGRANVPADGPRPDVGARWPALGPDHGVVVDVGGLAPGPHDVCAFAVNQGPGTTTLLGCRSITVAGGAPVGRLERADPGPRSLRVGGWAVDPDTTSAADVHVYVDGVGRANVPAGLERPDVEAAFPGYGPYHGYEVVVGSLAPGPHVVCAHGVDPLPPHASRLLGCLEAVVPSGSPVGRVDLAAPAGPSSVRVAGWALDPDTADPVDVHLYVDGVGAANVVADGERPDVARAFRGWGPAHGFDVTVGGLPVGRHDVCAFAVDRRSPGAAVLLRCEPVVVAGPVPAGAPSG